MSRHVIVQDQQRCIGCRACEVHCKVEHRLPPGPRLCEIVDVGPEVVDGVPRVYFAFMNCRHCEGAPCVQSCPSGALRQRSPDGIVTLAQRLCIGCGACLLACPWGAPQWSSPARTVVKCDQCVDRLDRGLQPACVTGCTTGALGWVEFNDSAHHKRSQQANAAGRAALGVVAAR